MTKKTNNVNTSSWRERDQSSKKFKWKHLAIALTVTLLATCWGDITQANWRKKADRKKYGGIELKNNETKTYDESSNNIAYFPWENWEIDSLRLQDFLDEILLQNNYNNDSISSTALLTTMTSENALKSDGLWHDIDEWLEEHWIERSKNSESITWFFLAKLWWNWSYWRFQTQREAIENWYKNDPARYENICKRIASFKLPNKNGKREELYKQLNYKSENEMISDLKEKDLPVYTWGGRLWIALWIVLLNEQLIDRNEWWNKYDKNEVINRTQRIKAKYLGWLGINDPIRQALNLKWSKWENLKSIYILSESNGETWLGRISFSDIQKTLQSPEFKAWEIAAWRCTDIEARKNWEYLLDLSIAELNERFNNEINWNHDNLSITPPTGAFWPTSLELALKHLDFLPAEIKDNANKENVKKYLNQHPELIKEFKEKVIADYIINFQRLFLLNEKNDRNELSEKQMDFLEQNLNLSFNHLYISEQCFHEYVKEKKWSTKELDSLRNDYITNVEDTSKQKRKRKEIAKTITHEEEFIKSTWLTKKEYEFFIKHRLWPALLWTSIILSETWNVVPENQTERSGTSNEVNTIYRFCAWTKDELLKMEEDAKWIPITLDTKDFNINTIKYVISKDKKIMEYIKNNCRDSEWNPITNIDQVSDEVIYNYTWINPIIIKGIKTKSKMPGNKTIKIYFNTNNAGQILSNRYNEWYVNKWENFCDFIFNAQKQQPRLSKILKNIIWKDSINKNDITAWVIKQIIRKPDWSIRENVNDLKAGESFIIVYPLNKKSKSFHKGPKFYREEGIDEGLILNWQYEDMKKENNRVETTKATKKEIKETLRAEPKTKAWDKRNSGIQDPKKKTPTPKNPTTPKRHTPQKK